MICSRTCVVDQNYWSYKLALYIWVILTLSFVLKTHLQPIGCLASGKGVKNQVLVASKAVISIHCCFPNRILESLTKGFSLVVLDKARL